MIVKFLYGAQELRSCTHGMATPLPRLEETVVIGEWLYLVIDVVHDYNEDEVTVHLQTV